MNGAKAHLQSTTACKAVFATSCEKSEEKALVKFDVPSRTSAKKIRRIIVRDCQCSQSLTIKMSEILDRSLTLEISNRIAIARAKDRQGHGQRLSEVRVKR